MDYLAAHWLALLLTGMGLILGGLSVLRNFRSLKTSEVWTSPGFVIAVGLLLLGVGDLWPWQEVAFWVAGAALVVLFVKLIVVVTTGEWLPLLGWSVAAILLLSLSGAFLAE